MLWNARLGKQDPKLDLTVTTPMTFLISVIPVCSQDWHNQLNSSYSIGWILLKNKISSGTIL
jgi:hypothetical protein